MIRTQYQALGLMSGSSLDGLDIAWVRFDMTSPPSAQKPIDGWELLGAETMLFSDKWISRLAHLPQQSALTLAQTHTYFGHYMAELVNDFLERRQIEPDFIASHGHTVFHHPDKMMTTQIGDGAALAALTGYPVVSDFRTHDVALRGEGTPIAPAADRYLFEGFDFYLNIGGIANISCRMPNRIIAFDVAPANQIFNRLANLLEKPYDHNGDLAASGHTDTDLLAILDENPYFARLYPKSMDNQWISNKVFPAYRQMDSSVEDQLHTACRHLAIQTGRAIRQIIQREGLNKPAYQMLVTGGGAFNGFLMKIMEEHCNKDMNLTIHLPRPDIIQFKEAILMALMGLLRVRNLPNCLASVTGAGRDSIGGAVFQGYRKIID